MFCQAFATGSATGKLMAGGMARGMADAWHVPCLLSAPNLPALLFLEHMSSISNRPRSWRGFLRRPSLAIGNLDSRHGHNRFRSGSSLKILSSSGGSPSHDHECHNRKWYAPRSSSDQPIVDLLKSSPQNAIHGDVFDSFILFPKCV